MKPKPSILTLLFVSLCVGWLAAGCATMKAPAITTVTERDNGRDLQVPLGHVLVVQLAGNPTTGYRWAESTPKDAEPIVQALGESRYVPDLTQPGMVGVGGTETFQFKALRAGHETLRLEYARSWEKNVPPVRVFTVNVTVE